MSRLFITVLTLFASLTCFGQDMATNNSADGHASPACVENTDFRVNICSPGDDATENSPVKILAAAKSIDHITTMQIYLDSKLVFHQPNRTEIDTDVSMAKGTHSIQVKAWDIRGREFFSNRTIHVNSESSPAAVSRFLYEATGSNNVQGFSVNTTTGSLTPLSQGPVSVGQGFSQWLAVDKAGRFLFVSAPEGTAEGGINGQDVLAGFRIDKTTGDLTPITGTPIVLNTQAGPIAVTPDGKFLYMQLDGQVAVYKVHQETGELTLVPGSPFGPEGFFTFGTVVSPSGKFLYLPQNDIEGFSLNPETGVPTLVPGSPFPIHSVFFSDVICMDPQGRFVFTGGLFLGTSIDVERVEADGSLKQVPGSPFNSEGPISEISTDATGKFLFAAQFAGPAGILAYRIDPSSGNLTLVPGSPFAALGGSIGGFTTDASGKFLYVGTAGLPGAFAIDRTTGALTPLPSNPPSIFGFDNAVVTVAY